MDGARDTVLKLEVHLGNCVFREYRCVRDITCYGSHVSMCSVGFNNSAIRAADPSYFQAPSNCRMSQRDLRMAADSTMLRIVNLFIALSLGVQREQLEHLMGLT